MFYLLNGKPIFYIGKINEIGYATEEEKEEIIKQLKEDNPNIEIIDEPIEIDKDLKEKAIELGKLQLTYSKSEFMKYLNGEKTIPRLEVKQLKEENKNLKKEVRKLETVNKANILAIMEVHKRINSLEGVEE